MSQNKPRIGIFAVTITDRITGKEHLSVVPGQLPSDAIKDAHVQFDKEFPCNIQAWGNTQAGKITCRPVNFHFDPEAPTAQVVPQKPLSFEQHLAEATNELVQRKKFPGQARAVDVLCAILGYCTEAGTTGEQVALLREIGVFPKP